jgi:hypothetical protein
VLVAGVVEAAGGEVGGADVLACDGEGGVVRGDVDGWLDAVGGGGDVVRLADGFVAEVLVAGAATCGSALVSRSTWTASAAARAASSDP